MSKPINLFTQNLNTTQMGNLRHIHQQIAYWQHLSQIIQPRLPQPETWQVVCYEHAILTVSGLNQAMVSQLNYMQAHYVAQLQQLSAFQHLNKIRATLRYSAVKSVTTPQQSKAMSTETKQMLQETAALIQDAKLSQALLNLASDKK